MITQGQMFCLGVVMIAAVGVAHKLQAQTAPAPSIGNMIALPICTDPSGTCPLPDGIKRDAYGIPMSAKVRSYLDDEELAKIRAAVTGQSITTPTVTNGSIFLTNKIYRCDDGWSLVDTGSRPMCARELREPK